MAKIKTRPTDEDVTRFLDSVPDERRRAEGHDRIDRGVLERLVREAWSAAIDAT